MAFAASTACCKPSPLLAPRASSLRAQALLCRPSSAATTPRGLRVAPPAFAVPQAPAPRRRAASTGIVCGKVTKGSVPPNFTLKDQDGKAVSLSKYKGKPVVLYFYPADETPGCTKQIIRRREKTFTAFGSFGASSPLASPLLSKRHGSTAVQALLSSPDHTPQQHRLTIPSQEGIEAAAAATKRQQTQEPGTEEEIIMNAGGRTCELPTWALIGGITAGVALALALSVDAGPAMALGPEGPLVEEFWDNMRRYGLYALTVSTGFAWALVQPIVELLRNPITAVLIIVVIAGGGVLVSQVINAMAGNSDFIYMYEQ